MFVAIIDDRIVGIASVARTDYYPLPDVYPWVSGIFVSEEYRGRKISGDLISYANQYLKEFYFIRKSQADKPGRIYEDEHDYY